MLDNVTWPEFVWEYLALQGSPLSFGQFNGSSAFRTADKVPNTGSTGQAWAAAAETPHVPKVLLPYLLGRSLGAI